MCMFLSLRLGFIELFPFSRRVLSFLILFAFRDQSNFEVDFLKPLFVLSIYHSSVLGFSILYLMIVVLF